MNGWIINLFNYPILIIGGDSYIGNKLYYKYVENNIDVYKTTKENLN